MALIQYLTRIQFEVGAARLIGDELKALKVTRPLVVTDGGVVAAGLLRAVYDKAGLPAFLPVFDRTPPNPTEEAAVEAAELFAAERCNGVLAIGGGSPIDLAKTVALLATHPAPLDRYALIEGGADSITSAKPPVVAVPTTAGTGSEVGRAALITLADGRKLGLVSPHLIPNVAICDPELTLSLPSGLTAATGFDAITHCIETFLSPKYNPVADSIAIDGLQRAVNAIGAAVEQPADIVARSEMMMAALQGGLTFQKGLGAVHSLSHPLGALSQLKLHHGTLNAVLLPAVLRFNAPAAEAKFEVMARALGTRSGAEVVERLVRLREQVGLPSTLSAMGVPRDCFEIVADGATKDHSTPSNVRPVAIGDFRELLAQSY